MSKIFKIILGIIAIVGVVILGVVVWAVQDFERYQALTPEQQAAENARHAAEQAAYAKKRLVSNKDGRDCLNLSGQNSSTVDQLKESLREPSSFEHISTIIHPVDKSGNHELVMRYRAKNGFGGYSFGVAVARVSNLDCSSQIVESN